MIAGIGGTNLKNTYEEDGVAFASAAALVCLVTVLIGMTLFLRTKKHFW